MGVEGGEQAIGAGGPAIASGADLAELGAAGAVGGVVEESAEGGMEGVVVGGVEVPAGLGGDFGEGGGVGQGDGAALSHGLDGRDSEAFTCGWEDQSEGFGVGGAEDDAIAVAGGADDRRGGEGGEGGLKASVFVGRAGADENEGQFTAGDLGESGGDAGQPFEVFAGLEVGDGKQVGEVGGQAEVGADGGAFGGSGGLEEEVVGGVGDEGDGGGQGGEGLADAVGVEVGDREDEVGGAEDAGEEGEAARRAEGEILEQVVASDGAAGNAGGDEEFGGSVDPVEGAGELFEGRPAGHAPEAKHLAEGQWEAELGAWDLVPGGAAFGGAEPPGDGCEGDLVGAAAQLGVEGQGVAGDAGWGACGVEVVDPADAERGRAVGWASHGRKA